MSNTAAYYREYYRKNPEKKKAQAKAYQERKKAGQPAKRVSKSYATRKIDFEAMVHIQVNPKTWVLAPKGANPETVRQNYLSKHQKAA